LEPALHGTQVPLEQTSLPLHALPHAPQLKRSFRTSVQLPLQHLPPAPNRLVQLLPHAPQLPTSTTGLLHPPPQQLEPAAHFRPQEPQLPASLEVLVHTVPLVAGQDPGPSAGQPGSVTLPWQHVDGELHGLMGVHTPLLHVVRSGHTLPHLPQLLASLVVFLQAPLQQVVPAAHLRPQEPQLFESVVVLVHTVPLPAGHELGPTAGQPGSVTLPWQHVDGELHGLMGVQTPLAHVLPAGHTLPHLPQLLASLVVFLQAPLQHVAPAAHLLPQAPQLLASVVVLVQTVPLLAGHELGPTVGQPGRGALPWQHVLGCRHGLMGVHTPLLHVLPPGQTVPHLPQLLASLVVFLQAPLQHVAPAAHLLPQVPQLLGSVVVLVHTGGVGPTKPVAGHDVGLGHLDKWRVCLQGGGGRWC
jgi:hypothetical protein